MKLLKTILILGSIYLLFVGFLFIAADRFEKIENGEITLIKQND